MGARWDRKVVGSLMLALSAVPTIAKESWRAMPTEARNILFSIDEASLTRDGDMVKFWEKLVYVVPEKRDEASGKMVKQKLVHRVMDCKRKTQAHIYAAQIAEDGKRIEVIQNDEQSLAMTPIRPNTIADQELMWACTPR